MSITVETKMRTKSVINSPEKLEKNDILRHKNQNTNEESPTKMNENSVEQTPNQSGESSSPSSPPALSPAYSIREAFRDGSEEMETSNTATSSAEKQKNQLINKENKKKDKKKKSKNKNEDVNAPKRWRTAYVQFMLKRRPQMAKDKSLTLQDLNRGVAAEWQALNAENRKEYEALAMAEKERYEAEMKVYVKTPEYAEFKKQKMKEKGKKRKRSEDSDNDEPTTSKIFPPANSFCPLMNADCKKEETEFSYTGKIFSSEFVAYNKTRESYRRQLQMERSNLLHELEALHDHDLETKIDQQEQEIKKLDKKLEGIIKSMNSAFNGIQGAQDHLSNLESLTNWLRTVSNMNSSSQTRKSVREAISKIKKL